MTDPTTVTVTFTVPDTTDHEVKALFVLNEAIRAFLGEDAIGAPSDAVLREQMRNRVMAWLYDRWGPPT